jgi:ketosteroid isomerase-like protein
MRDIERQRAMRLRDQREIQAIYTAMAAAQKRGDLKATLKFFAPDIQVVNPDGTRSGVKELQRVLALPAATMRLDAVKISITDFARRGILADAKVMTHLEATSKKTPGSKPQRLVIETLRNETWRRTRAGWRLIFSKTLAQITRAR